MPRANLSREAVVTAAVKLGDRNGFDALTMGSLARALGIKPPSLYKHVESLDDLIDAIGVRGAEQLTAALSQAQGKNSPEKNLAAACVIYRGFAAEHPVFYQSLQPAMARRSAAFQRAAKALLETIYSFVTPLGVANKDLVHAVRMLRSLLHGFVELERSGGFGMPVDIEESFRYLVRHLTAILRRT